MKLKRMILAISMILGAVSCNAQENAQKTKSFWQVHKESKALNGVRSLYGLSYIEDGGFHQQYHFFDIEKKGQKNCCQNSVSPYAEYYIIKSLYDAQNDATHNIQHDITARFLVSQKLGQGHVKNLYLRYMKNYAYKIYQNIEQRMYEYQHGKMLSYVPLCWYSTPRSRICAYVNNMPNIVMRELITDQDVERLSSIAGLFDNKVGDGDSCAIPPAGLLLRADFVHEHDKQAYLALMEVDKKVQQHKKRVRSFYGYPTQYADNPEYVEIKKNLDTFEQEWQKETATFLKNLKEDAVSVTPYSFIPNAVEEFHAEVDCVVSDIKKRYEASKQT